MTARLLLKLQYAIINRILRVKFNHQYIIYNGFIYKPFYHFKLILTKISITNTYIGLIISIIKFTVFEGLSFVHYSLLFK